MIIVVLSDDGHYVYYEYWSYFSTLASDVEPLVKVLTYYSDLFCIMTRSRKHKNSIVIDVMIKRV